MVGVLKHGVTLGMAQNNENIKENRLYNKLGRSKRIKPFRTAIHNSERVFTIPNGCSEHADVVKPP